MHSVWKSCLERNRRRTSADDAAKPGQRCLDLTLELGDQVSLGQREADIVQAIEQAVLAELVNLKGEELPVGCVRVRSVRVPAPASASAAHLG